ncbi:MAG: iron ABC transporter permease [Thermodesulfobacteriota bacterium]
MRKNMIRRWLNLFRARASSPQFILTVVLLSVLAYLVLVPLYGLAERTLLWHAADTRISRNIEPGTITVFHWKNILSGRISGSFFYKPLLNTLLTGTIAALIAMLLGSILSWLVTRTDLPGRSWLKTLLTLPYIIPAFAIALAWETLFRNPNIGGQPGFFQVVFHVPPPEWLSYGPVPIIATMVIHFFPFALLLVSGALATIDTQLEEGAELLGAGRWTILRKITFPVVAPAIMAAFVLTFGRTIGTFALPYLLGGPIRYYTLSTMLFTSLKMGFEPIAYVLGIILIIITSLVVYGSNRYLGKNLRRFETVGGKGFKGEPTRLGQWRWPVFSLVGMVAFITAIFPLILLTYQTLMLVRGRFDLGNLTLHFWVGTSNPNIAHGEPGVLHNPIILGAIWNSVRLSVLSSVISAILGLVIAYLVVRNHKSITATLLDQISFLPFLFPAIAFGAMYLSIFATRQGPIPALYGTFTLLVVISVVKRLPYAVRTGTSAITQIGLELEEAAEIEGASWYQRIRKVVMPLATSGIVSGMMVTFVGMMRELSLIILLITPQTRVLMTLGLRYTEENQVQLSNALVLLVTLITIFGELIVWWLGKSRLSRLRENQMAGKKG